MTRYCKGLGLQLLNFTKNGHAVYGDPNAPHLTFTDSAPHAKHISEDHYQNARRTAEEIRASPRLIEHFAAGPAAYADSYTFCSVHNECARDGRTCHEVYVPGVRSATGAGDCLREAMDTAREMLTLLLGNMQARGDPMPAAMSVEDVQAHAKARELAPVAGFTIEFRGVVAVETLPHCRVPELTEAEQEMVQISIREVWRGENQGTECDSETGCLKASPISKRL
jgi:predicted RNase H-like HicB family nuclease